MVGVFPALFIKAVECQKTVNMLGFGKFGEREGMSSPTTVCHPSI